MSQFENLIKFILRTLFVLVLSLVGIYFFPKDNGNQRLPAAINRAAITMAAPSKVLNIKHGLSPELLDSYYSFKASENQFDVSEVLPLDLQPSNNSNLVFSKIADKSVSSFFNSDLIRSTPVGRTATVVEHKLKQDISFQGGKIDHKFTLHIQAFQATAKVAYSGYTNASIQYHVSNSAVGLELYEKITKDNSKDLVMSHVTNSVEKKSSLSVRWGF